MFSKQKIAYMGKNGNFKKMLKNEYTPFYMFVPPLQVTLDVSYQVEFFAWVEYLG